MTTQSNLCGCDTCVGIRCTCGCQNSAPAQSASCQCGDVCGDVCNCGPTCTCGGLAGHGVQDAVHSYIVVNAGVPAWWPAWCLAYDVGAAGVLAWLLMRAKPDLMGVTA